MDKRIDKIELMLSESKRIRKCDRETIDGIDYVRMIDVRTLAFVVSDIIKELEKIKVASDPVDESILDQQADEIIHSLDEYSSGVDRYCLGLPMSEPEFSEMKSIVFDIINIKKS